jgi:hypothetical protein
VRTILVLSEGALRDHDVARINDLFGPPPVTIRVLVPQGDDRSALTEAVEEITLGELGEVLHPDHGFDEATAREVAERGAAALAALGLSADGDVVPSDPVPAVAAAAAVDQAEQILVLTEPHPVEDALRHDWASRLRLVAGIPVLHVLSGTDQVIA